MGNRRTSVDWERCYADLEAKHVAIGTEFKTRVSALFDGRLLTDTPEDGGKISVGSNILNWPPRIVLSLGYSAEMDNLVRAVEGARESIGVIVGEIAGKHGLRGFLGEPPKAGIIGSRNLYVLKPNYKEYEMS